MLSEFCPMRTWHWPWVRAWHTQRPTSVITNLLCSQYLIPNYFSVSMHHSQMKCCCSCLYDNLTILFYFFSASSFSVLYLTTYNWNTTHYRKNIHKQTGCSHRDTTTDDYYVNIMKTMFPCCSASSGYYMGVLQQTMNMSQSIWYTVVVITTKQVHSEGTEEKSARGISKKCWF